MAAELVRIAEKHNAEGALEEYYKHSRRGSEWHTKRAELARVTEENLSLDGGPVIMLGHHDSTTGTSLWLRRFYGGVEVLEYRKVTP